MDKNNSSQEDLWKQCPKGMLREVAVRNAERNRIQKDPGKPNKFDRRGLLKIAAAIAVTGGAGTIAYRSLFPAFKPFTPVTTVSPGGEYGGITCEMCLSNIEKYIQKGLEDHGLVAKMDKHLELCDSCRAKYDMMRNA